MSENHEPIAARTEPHDSLFDLLACIICGVVTALSVVLAHYYLYVYAGISLYTYMVWGIIPGGSILLGIIAGGGFYVGAALTHYMPRALLLLIMLATAVFTQAAIYYIDYSQSKWAGTGFYYFMQWYLTNMVYSSADPDYDDEGFELGEWGYAVAAIQLVGFLVGSLTCYVHLLEKPACKGCHKFYKKLGQHDLFFPTWESFTSFDERLREHDMFSRPYMGLITQPRESLIPSRGVVQVTYGAYECPSCHGEMMKRDLYVHNGEDFNKADDWTYKAEAPENMTLSSYFMKA